MNYKNLKRVLNTFVKENSSYTDPDAGFSLTDGSIAPFAVEDPEVLKRINAFLRAFCTERHQDPKYAIVILRTKLNTIGLDFPYDGRRPLSPDEVFHMTQFGGRQGMNDKGEFFTDCGITHRTNGKTLNLHVKITPINAGLSGDNQDDFGPYYIHAKLEYGPEMKITVKDLEPETNKARNTFKK